ncbi:MAG TPA: alpha/beta hydrolase [Kiloniellales bacterium]|nr:alpha/beta hydrolase [Kiloniellales bacterium]
MSTSFADDSQRLSLPGGAHLAYCRTAGRSPGIVFLGGFNSDMTGTKALRLEAFAKARGQAFLRFDYQGHGQSSGRFEDGTIGTWLLDAITVLDVLTTGPQVLVGSSMGGWIMLLVARERPERIAGLLGIASAPDFTQDLIWDELSPVDRQKLSEEGRLEMPSDYGDPYIITRDLIAEGQRHLLLRSPLQLTCPVRLVHGTADNDVPFDRSLMLLDAVDHDDVELTLVKNGDHRLSDERGLSIIEATLARLLDRL